MFEFSPGVTKTARGYLQVNAGDIRRAFRALRTRESRIGAAERRLAEAAKPTAKEKLKAALEKRIRERDYTRAKIENMLEFVKTHNLTNTAAQAVEHHAHLRHLIAVKDEAFLAAQVAGRNSKSDEALNKLVQICNHVIDIHMRSSPLAQDDAFSRAIQGVWDAAMRFAPERSTARFPTVAYNWIRRNTRARTLADLPEKNVLSLDDLLDKEKVSTEMSERDDTRPRKLTQISLSVTRAKHYNPRASTKTDGIIE